MKTTTLQVQAASGKPRFQLSCALLGHRAAAENSCACLAHKLTENGTHTHVRHILSCFISGHEFKRLVDRDGHHEYVCRRCGHQLLVADGNDPFVTRPSFVKRPRYWCSIFGHRVRTVGERSGLMEYVCNCGHSFMRPAKSMKRIKHPVVCTLAGHFVRFIGRRDGYVEYVCGVCGHTFCYTLEA